MQTFGRGPSSSDKRRLQTPAPASVATSDEAEEPAEESVGGGFGFTALGAPSPAVMTALQTPVGKRTPQQTQLLKDRRGSEQLAEASGLRVTNGISKMLLDEEEVPKLAQRDAAQAVAYDNARTQELEKLGRSPTGGTLPPSSTTAGASAPISNPFGAPGAAGQPGATKPVGYALRQMPDGSFRGVSGNGPNQKFQNFGSEAEALATYRPPQNNVPAMAAQSAPALPVAQMSMAAPAAVPTSPAASPMTIPKGVLGGPFNPGAIGGYAKTASPAPALPTGNQVAATPNSSAPAGGSLLSTFTSPITNPFTSPTTKINIGAKKLGQPRKSGFQSMAEELNPNRTFGL